MRERKRGKVPQQDGNGVAVPSSKNRSRLQASRAQGRSGKAASKRRRENSDELQPQPKRKPKAGPKTTYTPRFTFTDFENEER